jgi:hypothetical protein
MIADRSASRGFPSAGSPPIRRQSMHLDSSKVADPSSNDEVLSAFTLNEEAKSANGVSRTDIQPNESARLPRD